MRFRIFTEPQEGATYDDQLAVALLAEELGFDAYFRSDHYISFTFGDGMPGPTDAWITLAGLARDTTTLRLGTLVSPITFRLPGPLAIAVAQIDAMSGGRVELGLGAGWNDREHAAYGIPFPPTGERFDRLEDQLAIITGLWSTPVGRALLLHGHALLDRRLPRAAQAGAAAAVRRSSWAGSAPSARRGSRRATPTSSTWRSRHPTRIPEIVGRVAAACEAIGRDPGVAADQHRQHRGVRRRRRRGRARARRTSGATSRPPGWPTSRGRPPRSSTASASTATTAPTTVYFQVLDLHDLDHLRLLAEEVLPAFRVARSRPTSLNECSVGPPGPIAMRVIDATRTNSRHPTSSPTPSAHAIAALIGDTWLTTTTSWPPGLVEQLLARAADPGSRASTSDSPPGGHEVRVGAPRGPHLGGRRRRSGCPSNSP